MVKLSVTLTICLNILHLVVALPYDLFGMKKGNPSFWGLSTELKERAYLDFPLVQDEGQVTASLRPLLPSAYHLWSPSALNSVLNTPMF